MKNANFKKFPKSENAESAKKGEKYSLTSEKITAVLKEL